MVLSKEQISGRLKELQQYICDYLEKVDGKAHFVSDNWTREAGGGGRTNTISNGDVIEKGGVAFSEVFGPVSEQMKNALLVDGSEFYATGVSIVIHPSSPHVPIIHMNVRYFEYDNGKKYWFGGGIDLTPHYVIPGQAADFHKSLKAICDNYHPNFYSRFKTWADDYFFQPHRNETRGIGGIFYDHIDETSGLSKEQLLHFAVDLGEAFPKLYEYQVELGKNKPVSPEQFEWRNIRRGRYVEFNLLHDRGTKFGLHSGGRTESILMSLPKDASWEYMKEIPVGSEEEKTLNWLKKGIDWVNQ
jgi:coproporphyrinogen III oxidase